MLDKLDRLDKVDKTGQDWTDWTNTKKGKNQGLKFWQLPATLTLKF